jgi:hypothetical protein
MRGAYRIPASKAEGIKRTAVCNTCGATTVQTIHGYTTKGGLWKGHVCACEGWHCQSCKSVTEKKRGCCR